MLFSRNQLNQLAKTNGYSINTLISEQKKLKRYQLKRIDLQKQMKEVLSSKNGELASGSSLLMGRINTNLLKQYGYDDINELIAQYEQNDIDIEAVKKKVIKEDNKIKTSLSVLKDVDITKDMETQVTQEVLLDSDLADVRNNSQEILLMLSQSKTSEDVLNVAKRQIDINEKKIADYMTANRRNNKSVIKDSEKRMMSNNETSKDISNRLSRLSNQQDDDTLLNKLNNKISGLSPKAKNGLLLTTFVAFFGVGLSSTIKSTDDKKDKDG